jgi:hypothetical protein
MVVELPLRKRWLPVKPQVKAASAETTTVKSSKPAVSITSPAPQTLPQVQELSPERVTRSKLRSQTQQSPHVSYEPAPSIPPVKAAPVTALKPEKGRPSKPKSKTKAGAIEDEPPSKRHRPNGKAAAPIEKPDVVETSLVLSKENDNPFEAGLHSTEQVGLGTSQRWDDLDEEDINDPLMVTEYVIEIFEYMKELEVRLISRLRPYLLYLWRNNERCF